MLLHPRTDVPPHSATDSRGAALSSTLGALTAVSGVLVGMRLYGRAAILRRVEWDDYCIAAAMLFSLVLTVFMCLSVDEGLGEHIWVVGQRRMQVIMEYAYVNHLMAAAALGFSRASILLQVLRLASTSRLRHIFQMLLVLSTVYSVLAFGFQALICGGSPWRFWKTLDAVSGREPCLPYFVVHKVLGVIAVLLDFAVWLSPLRIVWYVKTVRGWEKFALRAAFALGALVWAADIIRLSLLYVDSKQESEVLRDPSYAMVPVAMWLGVEVHVAIICACVPTLRPLLTFAASKRSQSDPSSTDHSPEQVEMRKRTGVKSLPSREDGFDIWGGYSSEGDHEDGRSMSGRAGSGRSIEDANSAGMSDPEPVSV